jgi:uncharacterized membrane protein (UPF0136 family)
MLLAGQLCNALMLDPVSACRAVLDPGTADISNGSPVAWKASILIIMLGGSLMTLCIADIILSTKITPSSTLGSVSAPTSTGSSGLSRLVAIAASSRLAVVHIQTTYRQMAVHHQRNVCVYVMHVVLDTILLGFWVGPLTIAWCGCNETVALVTLVQCGMAFIVASYLVELTWRTRHNKMIVAHHVLTIAVIVTFAMDLAWRTRVAPDPLVLLALFAVMEQPTFVALLLHRFCPRTVHVVRAWLVAFWCWVVFKLASVGGAIYFLHKEWDQLPAWLAACYVFSWAALGSLEGHAAYVHWRLYQRVRNELRDWLIPDPAAKLTSGASPGGPDSGGNDSSRSTGV